MRPLRWCFCRPAPISGRVGKLGLFVQHPTALVPQTSTHAAPPRIGFVLLGSLVRPIRLNSFPVKELYLVSVGRKLASFCTLWSSGTGLGRVAGPCPFLPAGRKLGLFGALDPARNWLRFARLSLGGKLGSFRMNPHHRDTESTEKRIEIGRSVNPESPLCLCGESSMRMCAGPLTTRPSEAMIAYL